MPPASPAPTPPDIHARARGSSRGNARSGPARAEGRGFALRAPGMTGSNLNQILNIPRNFPPRVHTDSPRALPLVFLCSEGDLPLEAEHGHGLFPLLRCRTC